MRPNSLSFFPDAIRKCAVVFLAVVCVMLCWPNPAELKPMTRLRFRPLLYELDSIKMQLKRLLADWGETEFQVDDTLIRHVSYFIKYYTVEDVERSNRAIQRSRKYLRNIKNTFKKYDIPEDVAFALPFVESSFNRNARSSAGAVGMFQFIDSTARNYGLVVNGGKRDERLDYKKAAQACARYLRDSNKAFSSTIFSLGSYHHGTRTVAAVLPTCGSGQERKFGPMFQHKRLGPFSKEYIPQCLAAALIYRYLEKSKQVKLAVPAFESRTIGAPKPVRSFENQVPNLRHINPDLYYAKATYSYAGTNGYVLLTKVDYPPRRRQ